MKARFPKLLIPIIASLLIGSLGGCTSAPGQNALAARLSTMKTFSIYGSKDAKGLHPLTDGPVPETVTQAVREGLEARGYRYQEEAPDFQVIVSWQKSLQPPPQSPAPAVDAREVPPVSPAFTPEFNSFNLNLVVRARLTDQVLWWSPATKAEEAQNITESIVRVQMREMLKDFPPALD